MGAGYGPPNTGALTAGAASSTDKAVARFSGVTGKVLQNSLVTIADDGAITFPANVPLRSGTNRILWDDGTQVIVGSFDLNRKLYFAVNGINVGQWLTNGHFNSPYDHTFGATNGAEDVGVGRAAAGELKVTDGGSGLGKIVVGGATPTSATAVGTAGTVTWDANFVYICVATNTWKRVGIATW